MTRTGSAARQRVTWAVPVTGGVRLPRAAPDRFGTAGYPGTMFFFSNRIGCLGSLLVSLVATVVLIMIFSR
ncbi:hypothetical protein GCM10010421_54780 [Streptomyces glaucus]|uniref:Secreted protein n=1 Tax=Streptomyces glaucus TaxID=284029 RepID=A0ABP5XFR5_9ACTN